MRGDTRMVFETWVRWCLNKPGAHQLPVITALCHQSGAGFQYAYDVYPPSRQDVNIVCDELMVEITSHNTKNVCRIGNDIHYEVLPV